MWFFFILFYFIFAFFSGPHLRHMEVPRIGVPWKIQLPAYATAIATQDPSRICHLHHSSRQRQFLHPLSEARDRTHNLMVPRWIHFCCTITGTPGPLVFNFTIPVKSHRVVFNCRMHLFLNILPIHCNIFHFKWPVIFLHRAVSLHGWELQNQSGGIWYAKWVSSL